MSKPFRFGSAVSFVALASVLGGCASAPTTIASASSLGGKTDGDVGLATRALVALNSNQVATAIGLAERAVEHSPDDAGFRALLGNAYFAGGRFASAEAAFKDALSIYSNQPQVVLKLALAEIAQGKTADAVAFLDAGRAVLDPADYGLALALAGRASDAIPVLETAARANGADARARQNLALAYAFAGDWTNARVIASQDVPAGQLDERIHQWMQLAKPARASDQIAALTGITPAAVDSGQPVRLALRRTDTRLAQATPAPEPQPQAEVVAAPVPPLQIAATIAPPPRAAPAAPPVVATTAPRAPAVQPTPAIAPTPPPAPAPVIIAQAAAAAPDAPAAFAAAAIHLAPPVAPKPVKVRHVQPLVREALRRSNSGAVVQLGAYGSADRVNAAWSHLTQRYPALRAYLPMRARFVSPKGIFWRLSITGFDSQRDALARCQLLRGRGGSCFVRGFAGDAPVEIASR
jgi:D-alanyl-D-alanine carboxypeptidase